MNFTAWSMSEYWFPMSGVFPYKDRIVDYVIPRKVTDQKNPYSYIIYAIKVKFTYKTENMKTLKIWNNKFGIKISQILQGQSVGFYFLISYLKP